MSEENTQTSAATGQRLRRMLLAWPDVAEVHGPQMGERDVFYLRIEYRDGPSYSIELRKDKS